MNHPTEEQLLELLLTGNMPEVKAHVDACPDCAKLLADFREVRRRIAESPEEEIPRHLEERIMHLARPGRERDAGAGIASGLVALISNPLVIAAAVIAVVVVLWFVVGIEVTSHK